MLRIAAFGIIGLGAALLIAALLLSTYTAGKIKKIPLNIDVSLVSDGTGTALDPASLSGERFIIDKNVPLVSQQQITVESPANADVVTLQAGTTVRRSDKQQDNGLLLAMVDTVTLNRSTALAVSDDTTRVARCRSRAPSRTSSRRPTSRCRTRGCPTGSRSTPRRRPTRTSIRSRRSRSTRTTTAKTTSTGLTTYRFTQNVGYDADGKLVEPIKYASLYDKDEDGEVTARAALWGLPGDPYEPITMTRYYAAQRTFWVDPVTGTIVKAEEHANHYYARDPLKPEMALADYKVTSNEQTVESQAAARDERDRVALVADPADQLHRRRPRRAGRRALLGTFSVRAESALIDPGLDTADHGFFGKDETGPMPAAEAATEKLPAQRREPPPPDR